VVKIRENRPFFRVFALTNAWAFALWELVFKLSTKRKLNVEPRILGPLSAVQKRTLGRVGVVSCPIPFLA
jgi:hypothetical protein